MILVSVISGAREGLDAEVRVGHLVEGLVFGQVLRRIDQAWAHVQ